MNKEERRILLDLVRTEKRRVEKFKLYEVKSYCKAVELKSVWQEEETKKKA